MACRVLLSETPFAVNATKVAANASNSRELNKEETYECRADIKPVIEDVASHGLTSGVNDNTDKELISCHVQDINVTQEVAFCANVNTMVVNEAIMQIDDHTETTAPDPDPAHTDASTSGHTETKRDIDIPDEREKEQELPENVLQTGEDVEDTRCKYEETATESIIEPIIEAEVMAVTQSESETHMYDILQEFDQLIIVSEKLDKTILTDENVEDVSTKYDEQLMIVSDKLEDTILTDDLPQYDDNATDSLISEPEISNSDADTSIVEEDDRELKVSDVLEQAIQIGEDIEDINRKYDENATDVIIPKLLFVLGKLEALVTKHNENKSTIKALLMEQEDLKNQKEKTEADKTKLANQLEVAESSVKQGERLLQIQVKVFKAENKTLTKDLKKKKKKIKRKQNGGQGSFLWLLDRILFGGRIFFVTKELPRDVSAIRKLNVEMDGNRDEIGRLTRDIETQAKRNEQKEGTNIELQIENKYLEIEVSSIEKRLSEVETCPEEDETDTIIYTWAQQKNYKKVLVQGLHSITTSVDEENEQIKSCDTHSDNNRILITDSTEKLCYCEDMVSKTADCEDCVFEAPIFSHYDEEVTTRFAAIKNSEENGNGCEVEGQGVLLTPPSHGYDENNNNNNNIVYSDEMKTDDDEDEEFDIENIRYKVTVDVHSNRKDYKKLQLAQELRHTIKSRNVVEGNYDELYSNSDTKSDNSTDDNACYHWDEIDSKTSYEDVRSITSSDEKLHMYFILDKKNMSAKKVEQDEYQHFLEKSISLPKIPNAFDSEENLSKIDSTIYNNITSLATVSQIREESTITY